MILDNVRRQIKPRNRKLFKKGRTTDDVDIRKVFQ
jgi:hypothetical protein